MRLVVVSDSPTLSWILGRLVNEAGYSPDSGNGLPVVQFSSLTEAEDEIDRLDLLLVDADQIFDSVAQEQLKRIARRFPVCVIAENRREASVTASGSIAVTSMHELTKQWLSDMTFQVQRRAAS